MSWLLVILSALLVATVLTVPSICTEAVQMRNDVRVFAKDVRNLCIQQGQH